MNLQPIVDEMRQAAKNHVFDIASIANDPLTPSRLTACLRDITYHSYKIRITLTLDNLGEKKVWHFSVGPTAAFQIPNGIVNTLLEVFMPGDRLEIPSVLHPGYVRQFIQPYEEK